MLCCEELFECLVEKRRRKLTPSRTPQLQKKFMEHGMTRHGIHAVALCIVRWRAICAVALWLPSSHAV
jgi:hypothetical protein